MTAIDDKAAAVDRADKAARADLDARFGSGYSDQSAKGKFDWITRFLEQQAKDQELLKVDQRRRAARGEPHWDDRLRAWQRQIDDRINWANEEMGRLRLSSPGEIPGEAQAADYGWSLALLNSDPELRKLFDQAVTEGWTADRFTARLRDTQWYTTHQEAWRQNEILKYTDPKEWQARKDARLAEMKDIAARMGGAASDEILQRISDDSLMFGWNESQVRDALGQYITIKQSGTLGGQYIGDAGRNYTELMGLAKKNGYKVPAGKIEGWLRDIAAGDATVQDYGDFMRRQAAAMYPAWADELMAGSDLEDLVSPYKASMARLLEVPESSIDFSDRLLAGAMGRREKAGGKFTVLPLYDFEDQVRKDPRWEYTDNAHKAVLGAGNDVLKLMGFR